MSDLRAKLFRWELLIRSRLRLDCAGCVQREINRVGRVRIPAGVFRMSRYPDHGMIEGEGVRKSAIKSPSQGEQK